MIDDVEELDDDDDDDADGDDADDRDHDNKLWCDAHGDCEGDGRDNCNKQ